MEIKGPVRRWGGRGRTSEEVEGGEGLVRWRGGSGRTSEEVGRERKDQ